MCENSQTSVDEAIAQADDVLGNGIIASATGGAPVALSKKAINQRDADANLFLRFLELDPPVEATTAQSTPAHSTSELRRKSTLKGSKDPAAGQRDLPLSNQTQNQNGRTPFTITKKLQRTADKGFGFSIVWTHPPRIEKVEPGLSADRNGICPGDYVIFVDKLNVVTMPEMDILNLIKAQGNSLVLEVFRRASNGTTVTTRSHINGTVDRMPSIPNSMQQRQQQPTQLSLSNNYNNNNNNEDAMSSEFATPKQSTSSLAPARPTTTCSNTSLTLESTKRRLHLPQVTFSKESILVSNIEDSPRKYLYQLINREQHFVTALQYGIQRFATPLAERRDLISPTDHRTLFQNIEEILRIADDILEQIIPDEHEPQLQFASRVYLTKSTAFCAAYKKYCNGLKRADCVLVNKSRQSNSDFVNFITVPQVPRKRPDMTTLIHRPLQHFREVLKLIILLASHCQPNSEECQNFTSVISALQTTYREITVNEGLMEPLGEGRPLLTLQDLEARLVFTKCKPFVLAVPGRQWIFGGDLSRIEGRSVKPYWTLLFSDILLFAKVSRDRVLFITEEPIPLANIIDSIFHIRKKHTEFRITIDPNERIAAESPTVHCGPDLSRTPRKSARKHTIVLRAPSPELKAVWQNLLQRQVFLVNATLGSSMNSPLESPDLFQRILPGSEIRSTTQSMASIKLSADSINTKSQQVRLLTFTTKPTPNPLKLLPAIANVATTSFTETKSSSASSVASARNTKSDAPSTSLSTIFEHSKRSEYVPDTPLPSYQMATRMRSIPCDSQAFCPSSVGRSFFEDSEARQPLNSLPKYDSLNTPDTPEPNLSPTTSSATSKSFFSDAFSNDFMKPSTPSVIISPLDEHGPMKYASSSTTTNNTNGGSWDLIELDLDFHHVNLDPSFGGDVEEHVFFGDDSFCIPLPSQPTGPDSHHL